MLKQVGRRVLPPPTPTPLIHAHGGWIKPEGLQRTGSVKYRLVYARIEQALQLGTLTEESVMVEASSGSTGVALARAGRAIGLGVEIHAYATIAPTKRARIEEEGARLVLYPPGTPMVTILAAVRERVSYGAWHLNQFDRTALLSSYETLAHEVIEQLRAGHGSEPRCFVCPVGTGGLVQSVGTLLRQAFPGLRVIALEPEPGAGIDGMRNTDACHLGLADPYDRAFADERVLVPAPAAPATLHTGLALGASATAALRAIAAHGWHRPLVIAPD